MEVLIYRPKHFGKLLNELERAGGKALLAAVKAREIMEKLARSEDIEELNSRSEARIDRCGKFDLGAGYRLVYVRKKKGLIFLYIGAHDDCDVWIKNNRRIDPKECKKIEVEDSRDRPTILEDEPDYDEIIMSKLDDKILRRIFRGLCGYQERAL